MSGEEIQRLQDDLSTMRQVIKLDKPYAATDVMPLLLLGVGALLAIPLLEMRLFSNPRICLLLALSPGAALYARRYSEARRNQIHRPALWKEYKWGLAIGAVMIPASVGWIWWSQQFGLSREVAGAPIMFCLGIAGCVIGTVDADRRLYLLGGIGAIAFAFALPFLQPRHIATAGAVLLAVICFVAAAWIHRQTRTETDNAESNESLA